MANVEWEEMKAILQEWCNSKEGQEKIAEEADKIVLGRVSASSDNKIVSIEQLSQKLLNTLQKDIIASQGTNYADGQLGDSAINALSRLHKSAPYKMGNEYFVDIYFDYDLHRESLYPDGYSEGAINIADILNRGINSNKTNPAHGMWHGKETVGLLHREGAHFLERTREDFIREYPYAKVEINEEYI